MFATITNLITKKTFLSVFLYAVLFLTPLSLSIWEQDLPSDTVVSVKISSAQTSVATAVGPNKISGTNPSDAPSKKESGGSGTGISFLSPNVFNGLSQWFGGIILSIPSAFLWMAGLVFDESLKMYVFGMGDTINGGGLGVAINKAWVLIRDICNLAFIFGFVYVGIRTIIDPESASTKRFLSKIIIGALLINFSLFFVKFIVDFANFTSYQIYNTMTGGGTGSLSATIADKLGIITFFSSPSNPGTFSNLTSGGMFWFFIFAAVLLFVVAFILFVASFLFITRFVGIILIMIGSPILFGATVFPQTEHYASELWKKLISYAFFVPVFLLLLLISITLIDGLGIVPNGGNGFSAMLEKKGGPTMDTYGVILNFIVIVFFFIQSLLIAQKMGVAGGDAAVSMGNKLRTQGQRYLGNATFGAAAGLSRATIGKKAHEWSESDDLKDAASRRGFSGVVARQKLKLSRKVGDASFDARNINGLGNAIGAGEGRKGGYKTVMGEVEKKEKEFATSLGEVDDDDVQVMARKKEWEKQQQNSKAEIIRLRQEMKNPALSATDRVTKQSEIDGFEKKEKDAQIEYEKEKPRRTIGSTNATPDDPAAAGTLKTDIDTLKAEIKRRWDSYPTLSASDQKVQRGVIESLMKDLKKKGNDYAVMMRGNDGGYASVLENSNLMTAWSTGRLVTHEREAGKAIRKSAEKGLPKKKDD